MMKKKLYNGKEIVIDEEDNDVKSIHFIGNGVVLLFDKETYDAMKKELIEALVYKVK